ncbi:MAG TPA: alkaline phosphatase family protein [Candidatus Aquilonibacter sp.]|nr:alkaline phosphatase family protein [Candidatus Aquilonibacter sp.]
MKRVVAALLCSVSLLCGPISAPAQTAAATPSSGEDALVGLVRQKIKHVFVIYQENRSFDSYFGTFPGAANLATTLAQTQGFRQYDPLGNQWVTPFRITAADTADANHARLALITKADGGRMDQFISTEEFGLLARGYSREDAQRVGLLTMAFEDCDTIPYYWQYAKNFALYDHFFQGMYGPSTPGNIDLIAAQTGQTQWARHGDEQVNALGTGPGVPVVNDTEPYWGPYGDGNTPQPGTSQYDLTFATLFLTLSGKEATNAKKDDDDIKQDVASLAHRGAPAVPWGWYQEGFGEKFNGISSPYVTHHNALQYFGYLRNNPYFWRGVHDVKALLPAIQNGTLGDRGVVFVKGGYENPFGFKPADKSPYVQYHFRGDDDHPGYSDSQISEAFVAKFVNAIAKSKYWNDSLILITWDDSEGFYDHMAPPSFERCPDGHPCGDGPRVPAILISPFAKDHAVVSDLSDHTSFAKMLGKIFDLPALASLPDEHPYLPEGPRDLDPRLSDLLGGFDMERLSGTKLPIPASAAIVSDIGVPPKESCSSLGIVPVHIPGEEKAPEGFAPLTLEH